MQDHATEAPVASFSPPTDPVLALDLALASVGWDVDHPVRQALSKVGIDAAVKAAESIGLDAFEKLQRTCIDTLGMTTSGIVRDLRIIAEVDEAMTKLGDAERLARVQASPVDPTNANACKIADVINAAGPNAHPDITSADAPASESKPWVGPGYWYRVPYETAARYHPNPPPGHPNYDGPLDDAAPRRRYWTQGSDGRAVLTEVTHNLDGQLDNGQTVDQVAPGADQTPREAVRSTRVAVSMTADHIIELLADKVATEFKVEFTAVREQLESLGMLFKDTQSESVSMLGASVAKAIDRSGLDGQAIANVIENVFDPSHLPPVVRPPIPGQPRVRVSLVDRIAERAASMVIGRVETANKVMLDSYEARILQELSELKACFHGNQNRYAVKNAARTYLHALEDIDHAKGVRAKRGAEARAAEALTSLGALLSTED